MVIMIIISIIITIILFCFSLRASLKWRCLLLTPRTEVLSRSAGGGGFINATGIPKKATTSHRFVVAGRGEFSIQRKSAEYLD